MISLPNWLNAFRKKSTGGGGGGSGFILVGSVFQAGTSGDTTSPTLDTTGATDLFVLVTGNSLSHPTTIDNKSNPGWTADIDWNNSHISLFHCTPSSVGHGHTVTVQTVSGCNLTFIAVKKSGGTATLDGVSTSGSTGNWNSSTVRAGSLTPSTPNNLFLGIAWWDIGAGGVSDTVDSSFTKIAAIGTNPGHGSACKIKSADSSAENPGWVHAAGADGTFIQATYQ